MPHNRKDAKHPIVRSTGLYIHLERIKLDRRLRSVQLMEKAREGLLELFPTGVHAAASIIIDRVVYKALKLSIYEAMDIKGEFEMKPGSEQKYITMSNSLREDLRMLSTLADRKPPEAGVPSLSQYLASLKQAGQDEPPAPVKKTLF